MTCPGETAAQRLSSLDGAGDHGVAVGETGAEGELGPEAGEFLAGALAPGAGLRGAGLVVGEGVAAGVDAQEGEAAGVLLGGGDLLVGDVRGQGEVRAAVAVRVARVVEEDAGGAGVVAEDRQGLDRFERVGAGDRQGVGLAEQRVVAEDDRGAPLPALS
ncbi:hypothetical protein GCM10022221_27350 [Actinocorallia aurea]